MGVADQAVQDAFEDGDAGPTGGEQHGQLLSDLRRGGERLAERGGLGDRRQQFVPGGVVLPRAAEDGAEQRAGPGVVDGVERLGGEAQLRQDGLAGGLQTAGDQVERPLLEGAVGVAEGLGGGERDRSGALRSAPRRLLQPGELGAHQLLLGPEQHHRRGLGDQLRPDQPGGVQPGEHLLGVPGHRREPVEQRHQVADPGRVLLRRGRERGQDGQERPLVGGPAAAHQPAQAEVDQLRAPDRAVLGQPGDRRRPAVPGPGVEAGVQ